MKRRSAGSVILFVLVSCGGPANETPTPYIARPPVARTGLSAAERRTFYHLEEGSEVFPVDWFVALEDENGAGLFSANLERFGFIPDVTDDANPYGLPIGLTAAETRDLRIPNFKMLGLNCAACHVSQVMTPHGTQRLDGAPAHVDVSAFYQALAAAVMRTLDVDHPDRFLEFCFRVTTSPRAHLMSVGIDTSIRPDALDDALLSQVAAMMKVEEAKPPIDITVDLPLKPSRPNRATELDFPPTSKSKEANPSIDTTAGVTRKEDAARAASVAKFKQQLTIGLPQLNAHGTGPSAQVRAALLDNIGQTVRLLESRLAFLVKLTAAHDPDGVTPGFGRLDAFGGARNLLWNDPKPSSAPVSYPDLWSFDRKPWVHWDANTTSVLERNIGQALGLGAVLDRSTLASTVSILNLHQLELLAMKIQPPRWEDSFGAIDRSRAARGRVLFDKVCAGCHLTHAAELVEPAALGNVDPNRAENFGMDVSGRPNSVVIGELLGNIKLKAYEELGLTPDQQAMLENGRLAKWRMPKKYAAPILTSVWATAPYLHNNSVPTLRDLLRPAAKRPAVFYAGAREYNTEDLGFESAAEGRGRFKIDTSLPGNRNTGHEFGVTLADDEKNDLLEYLKCADESRPGRGCE